MNRDQIDSVLRSLRRVNLQGSLFGQTVAIRFGLSESDIEALEVLIDTGSATAGALSDADGPDDRCGDPGHRPARTGAATSGVSPTLPTAGG